MMLIGNDDSNRLLRVGGFLENNTLSKALDEASQITLSHVRIAAAVKIALYYLDQNQLNDMKEYLNKQSESMECYRLIVEQRPSRLTEIASHNRAFPATFTLSTAASFRASISCALLFLSSAGGYLHPAGVEEGKP